MADCELLRLLAAIVRRWILDADDDAAVAAFLGIDAGELEQMRQALRRRRPDVRSRIWK